MQFLRPISPSQIKQACNRAESNEWVSSKPLVASISGRVSNALPSTGKLVPISDIPGDDTAEDQRLRARQRSIQINARQTHMSSVHKDIGTDTSLHDVGEMQEFLNQEQGTSEREEEVTGASSSSSMWKNVVGGALRRAVIQQRALSCEFIMKKNTGTYLLLCITAFAGVVLQIGVSEHLYYDIPLGTCQIDGVPVLGWYDPGAGVTFIKLCISLLSAVSVWLTYVHYTDKLAFGIAQKSFMIGATLSSSGLMFPMLCEMIVLSIHSPPFMDKCFELSMGHLTASYAWTYDAVLSIGPLLRVYLAYGLFHYIWGYSKQRDARLLAALNHTDLTPWCASLRTVWLLGCLVA